MRALELLPRGEARRHRLAAVTQPALVESSLDCLEARGTFGVLTRRDMVAKTSIDAQAGPHKRAMIGSLVASRNSGSLPAQLGDATCCELGARSTSLRA